MAFYGGNGWFRPFHPQARKNLPEGENMGVKKLTVRLGLAAAALTLCANAGAQLLPPLPDVGDVLGRVDRLATDTLEGVGRSARDLADDRLRRLRGLVRENRDVLERTDLGPAVRGEVIAIDPTPRR
jgi:hypothetical protein